MVSCLELTLSYLLSGSPSPTNLLPLLLSLVHMYISPSVNELGSPSASVCSCLFVFWSMLVLLAEFVGVCLLLFLHGLCKLCLCVFAVSSNPCHLSLSPATIAAVTAVYMNHGLDYIRSSETGRLSYCPPGLLLVSLLLFFLQPQFDLSQV